MDIALPSFLPSLPLSLRSIDTCSGEELKGRSGKRDAHSVPWKALADPWNLEGHTYAQGCPYFQERLKKPNISPLAASDPFLCVTCPSGLWIQSLAANGQHSLLLSMGTFQKYILWGRAITVTITVVTRQ